jgi:hypothetical protein
LNFLLTQAPTLNGFFYHFMNMNTGARAGHSEVSSVDTAILLCGGADRWQHRSIGRRRLASFSAGGDACRTSQYLREVFARAWTCYGFVNAFNPLTGWYDPDVVGIGLGITLLMMENYQTQFVWNAFMKNTEINKAMALVGFR